jgi:hypothetical protein
MTKRQRLIDIAEQRCEAARLVGEAERAMIEAAAIFRRCRDEHISAQRRLLVLAAEQTRIEKEVNDKPESGS